MNTLKYGYLYLGIKTSEDWDATLENIKYYIALLEKHDHPVDINNCNKRLGLPLVLGLLSIYS